MQGDAALVHKGGWGALPAPDLLDTLQRARDCALNLFAAAAAATSGQ